MAKKIKAEQLENEFKNILNTYSSEVVDKAQEIVPKVSKDTSEELKTTSPKNTGKYAKSWKYRILKKTSSSIECTVYAGKYQLTHLLENGHLIKNGTQRVFGFTKAQPHISTAEKNAEEKLFKEIKDAI